MERTTDGPLEPRAAARSPVAGPGAAATRRLHPLLMMIGMLLLAAGLTYVVPAGRYDRVDWRAVPGTYRVIAAESGWTAIASSRAPTEADRPARAAGAVALLMSIPAGLVAKASLIFMVMAVGGMFGVLRATGAIDAGIDRLLHLASGNIYLLTGGLMLLLACGATFLGFLSEYIAIVPLVAAVGRRFGLPPMFAAAVVLVSAMTGYCVSVTNPLTLAVAQPLAGNAILDGVPARLAIFAVMFALGLGYVMLFLRRQPRTACIAEPVSLSRRHAAVLAAVAGCAVALVAGTALRNWQNAELTAAFIAFGVVLAAVGGVAAPAAADAFLDGMKGMLLAGLMIGLGGAMDVLLRSSQVLDSIIHGVAGLIEGRGPGVVTEGMLGAQMLLDLLIHSTSAAAGIGIPIMAPIARLAGVDGQVTVTALLLGSGVTNMISPTNGLLLAFLAAARIDYAAWFRFMAPLALAYYAVSVVALYLMAV